MLFASRKGRTRWQKLRQALWPSMGIYRVMRYYLHRMGRLKESPYAVAAGFASGIAISFTPFMGCHLLLGGLMTWALRGSMMAMVLGTVVAGNPWTFPLIWIVTYRLGETLMGEVDKVDSGALPAQFTIADLLHRPMELLVPMTLGSLPFALLSGIAAFYFVRQLMTGYKEARQKRIVKD